MFPVWMDRLSWFALAIGVACAAVMAVDVVRRPQKMGVMNTVWPVTGLFGGPLTLWGYLRHGRAPAPGVRKPDPPADAEPPFAAAVGKGALHCGAGCMLGDIAAEWLAFLFPAVAVAFGWHHLFDDKMYAVWVLDFVFAFALGIAFQYFAIVPMRGLSFGRGVVAAAKADALSLTAWQVGMYGSMAFAQLVVFPTFFGHRAEVDTAEFWFAMQLAMLTGFATAFPVNAWLIRTGVKERM